MKYTAAFFRMSLASITRFNSFSSDIFFLASSVLATCSAALRPCFLSQLYMLWLVTSSLSATEYPRSVTCVTASSLNSWGYLFLVTPFILLHFVKKKMSSCSWEVQFNYDQILALNVLSG